MFYVIVASTEQFVNYDYSTYLSNGTRFEEVATTVMPSRTFLESAKITFYEHSKHECTILFLNSHSETIRISAVYPDDDFSLAKQAIEKQRQNTNKYWCESFCFDGAQYYSYIFYVDGHPYALAYHVCSESKTISYILSKNDDYSSMNVSDVFQAEYGQNRVLTIS